MGISNRRYDRLRPLGPDFRITKRHLPHWQLGGSTYFVTFHTAHVELTGDLRRKVLAAFRYFDTARYTLWAAVVMPDHAHLLLTPLPLAPYHWWSLPRIMHSLKSFTSNEINRALGRKGPTWEDESFDRIIRDEQEFFEKWQYIRNNPVRAGLCAHPSEWDALYEYRFHEGDYS